MKMIVSYDGTLQSKEALRFAIGQAREKGAGLSVLHVFNSGLFLDYEAGLNAMDFSRRQSRAYLDEAKAIIGSEGKGVDVGVYTVEGDPEEELLSFAHSRNADFIVCTPGLKSVIKKYQRLAGSAAAGETTSAISMLDVKAA